MATDTLFQAYFSFGNIKKFLLLGAAVGIFSPPGLLAQEGGEAAALDGAIAFRELGGLQEERTLERTHQKYQTTVTHKYPPDAEAHRIETSTIQLYRLAMERFFELKRTLTLSDFNDELDRGLEVKIDGVGEAKVSQVDGIPAVRVLVNGYKLAILCLDLTQVRPGSEHLETFDARLKVNNNRDVLVADIREGNSTVSGYSFSRKRSIFTPQGIKDFWNSIKAIPTWGDIGFGMFWGFYQGGFVIALKTVQEALKNSGPLADFDWTQAAMNHADVAAFTGIFGLTIGIFATMYRNLINTGDTVQDRVLRSWLVGGVFTYTFVLLDLLKDQGATWTLLPLAIHFAGVAVHVTFAQLTKDEWNFRNRVDTVLRRNKGTFKLFGFDTGVRNRNVDNQKTYNFYQLPIKLLDVINFKIGGLSIGRLTYYLSIIRVRYLAVSWSNDLLPEIQKEFDDNPTLENQRKLNDLKKQIAEAQDRWDFIVNLFYNKPVGTLKWILSPWRWFSDTTAAVQSIPDKAAATVEAFKSALSCSESFEVPVSDEILSKLSQPVKHQLPVVR